MKYMDKETVFSISVLNSSQKDYADFFSKKDKEIVPSNLLFKTSDEGEVNKRCFHYFLLQMGFIKYS